MVDDHFAVYDKNNDSVLERNEYIVGIKEEEKQQGEDSEDD